MTSHPLQTPSFKATGDSIQRQRCAQTRSPFASFRDQMLALLDRRQASPSREAPGRVYASRKPACAYQSWANRFFNQGCLRIMFGSTWID